MSKVRVDVPYIGGLLNTYVYKIRDEFTNILNENKYIKKLSDDGVLDKIDIKFCTTTITDAIIQELLQIDSKIDMDFINKYAPTLRDKETAVVFSMITECKIVKGKAMIQSCSLVVKRASLAMRIVSNVQDLNNLWEYIKLELRHEAGHMIDTITNIHGKSREEAMDMHKEMQKDYEEFDKWVLDYKSKPGYKVGTVDRRYHNIPCEARADEYGGVDIEDMLKLEEEFRKAFKDKITTLEITTVETRPLIKNGKKAGSNANKNTKENSDKKKDKPKGDKPES